MQKPKIFNWSLIAIIALGLLVGVLLFTNHSSGFLLRQERAKVKGLEKEVDRLTLKAKEFELSSQAKQDSAIVYIDKIKIRTIHDTRFVNEVFYLSPDSFLHEFQQSLSDVDSHRWTGGVLVEPSTSK